MMLCARGRQGCCYDPQLKQQEQEQEQQHEEENKEQVHVYTL